MNSKKILCIDLDDTIALTSNTIIKFAVDFDKKVLKINGELKNIDNCKDYYYFAKMLGWNKEQLTQFFDNCYLKYLKEIRVKPEASSALKKIKALGISIYIVTSRREKENGKVTKITKNWLKQNNIIYDKLFINAINKWNIIKQVKPSYFLDDSFENCLNVSKVSKNTEVILMTTTFNKKIQNEQFRQISNLNELYDIIVRNENE